MNPDQIENSRLTDALNRVSNIETNMKVLTGALKQRAFIDARVAFVETDRLVNILFTLLDALDPPRQPLQF
jgi:hypothetical protein